MSFLSVKNICKSYKGEKVLNSISIDFPSKGMYLIEGESGGGKSTLLKCLSGVISCDSGDILFQDEIIKDFVEFRKNYMSFIFQDYQLNEYLSASDNVILPLLIKGEDIDSSRVKARKCLSFLGIEEKENVLTKYLSGGQKQRVAIARALVTSSPIILCDEVTGALDEKTSKEIFKILKGISLSKLVIIVSHDIKLVSSYVDGKVHLKKGESLKVNFVGEQRLMKRKSNNITLKGILLQTLFNLKKGAFRMWISIISLSLSFFLIITLLCAFYNVDNYVKVNKSRFMDVNMITVSKEEKINVPSSSLVLIKNTLPSSNEINVILGNKGKIHPSLEGVISSYPIFKGIKEEYSSIQFIPIGESSLMMNNFTSRITSYNQIILNDEAYRILKDEDELNLQINNLIKYKDTEVIIDEVNINMNLEVLAREKEFEFLNTPKAYYSLDLMEEYFDLINLPNLSSYLKKDVSLLDRLSYLTYEGDDLSSYKKVIEIYAKEDIEDVIDSFDDGYEVKSSSKLIIDEFTTAYSSFKEIGLDFAYLSLALSFSLLIQILYSFVLSLKKEIGLYSILGERMKYISLQFIFKACFICGVGYILSQILKIITISIFKTLFIKTGINLFEYYFCSNEILLFPCFLLIGGLCALVPSLKLSRMDLGDVIKEE